MTVRRCTALLSQSAPGAGRWLGDVIGQLARHAALMLFCITTYALAPVAGFGWLIATHRARAVPVGSASAARGLHHRVSLDSRIRGSPLDRVLLDWTLR